LTFVAILVKQIDTVEVTGSNPVVPTSKYLKLGDYFNPHFFVLKFRFIE